jgi:hypothetical protein
MALRALVLPEIKERHFAAYRRLAQFPVREWIAKIGPQEIQLRMDDEPPDPWIALLPPPRL